MMEKTSSKYKKKNIILGIILTLNIILIVLLLYFLSPVNKNGKDVDFIIDSGSSMREIANNLEKEGLIKNDMFFYAYSVFHRKTNIYAAKYVLKDNMSVREITKVLREGGTNADEITITFKEGLNMRQIAKVIEKNTNNTYEDVITLSNDEEYINELIKKYWFITNDIKNKEIYYALEGYLYPDSYNFSSKNVTVKEIFDEMISNMDKNLAKYKKQFEKSDYSTHEILTSASMIELEVTAESRKDIAGLFYNRLDSNMSLGSDPTSYYGAKKSMNSELSQSSYDEYNAYNTRAIGMEGKLPVGPISNPSINAIEAALNPNEHEYYYFVTDKKGKVYLTEDYETHNKIINKLKAEGLWLEW